MADEARLRPLGFPSLLALGVNGVVGVGIFFAPSDVARQLPGLSGAWVYLVTAVALLPIALGYGTLGSRFSVDGGPYVWAEAAFGARFAFFVGWIAFASALFSLAAVVTGLADHAAPVFGIERPGAVRTFAVASVLTLAGVAASGLRLSAMVWTSVTVLKLLPLALLVALGVIGLASPSHASPPAFDVTPHGLERAVLIVIFASQGFEIVPLLAGSVRKSRTAVPLATVLALLFAGLLYATLHALAARAVPDLASSRRPLVDAARAYGGGFAAGVVAAGANISALGIAFGMFNTTPRYLSALSGPGAFGPWIGSFDTRFVPQRALWLTTFATIALVAGTRRLSELFVLSSLAVLAQYGITLTSLGVLAWRRAHGLPRGALALVPLSLVGVVLAAQGAELKEVIVAAVVLLAGEGIRRAFAGKKRGEYSRPGAISRKDH